MAIRRGIVWLTLLTFTASSLGCAVTVHRRVRLTKEELIETVQQQPMLPGPIVEAGFDQGEVLRFYEPGATYSVERDVIQGLTEGAGYVEKEASDLDYVKIKTVNTGASVGLTILVWGVIPLAILVALIAEDLHQNSSAE